MDLFTVAKFTLSTQLRKPNYPLKVPVITLQIVFEEGKFANPRLHIANRVPKSVSILNSNHSEDLRLLQGSRKTFRSRVTNNNILNSRFAENKSANHTSREYPTTLLLVFHRHTLFSQTRSNKRRLDCKKYGHLKAEKRQWSPVLPLEKRTA